MRDLPFFLGRRAKTPGYGIVKEFYLNVFSSASVLPPILKVVEPTGHAGAVVGMGTPLKTDSKKEDLGEPMAHGAYALVSRDKKTVISQFVLSPSELSFEPEKLIQLPIAESFSPELVARLRGTWTISQFKFESFDPTVFPAIRFMMRSVKKFAELSEGVVADPMSQRYRLPDDINTDGLDDTPLPSRELISVFFRPSGAGLCAHTFGLQKFGMPEIEMADIEKTQSLAEQLLHLLATRCLKKGPFELGERIGPISPTAQIAIGGLDREFWEGIPCVEVIPPTGCSMSDWLLKMANAEA